MKSIRIQSRSFIQSLLKPATKLCDINDNDGHYCLSGFNTKDIYFKYREFPLIDGLQEQQAKNIIELTTFEFKNQLKLSQLNLSKYILRYNSLILSYPYACFVHQPVLNNLTGLMRRQLSFVAKLNIMIEIANGVQDLHRKNISIRSLRPNTVVILNRSQDSFQIAFSEIRNFAVLQDGCQLAKPVIKQTNAYMAPEVIKEKCDNNLSCDIWSMGLIFYELLFDNKFNMAKMEETGSLQFPRECLKWQKNIVEKMVVYEPKDRIKIRDIIILLRNARLSCNNILQ